MARFKKDAELGILQHRSGAPLARLLADQHRRLGNANKKSTPEQYSREGVGQEGLRERAKHHQRWA